MRQVHLNPRSPSLGPDSTSSDGIAIPQTVTEATDDAERASRGGWVFDSPEPLFGKSDLREVYDALSPGYRGRCTAPLLVDKATRRIVSNESADIVRMLGEAAGCIDGTTGVVLCPGERKAEIEEVNRWIYEARGAAS